MKAIFWALAIATMLTAYPAAADDHSANFYLPSCRGLANEHYGKSPLREGECVGILEGLSMLAPYLDPAHLASRSCVPDDATFGQLTTVVVRWLDQHPQRWHEDFRSLALLALHDAWPCK
jgi:hypothetical protein